MMFLSYAKEILISSDHVSILKKNEILEGS